MMRWYGLTLALGMVLTGAQAQAGPCDRYSNAFQYNDCLANLAPPRAVKKRGGGGGDPEKNVRSGRRRGSAGESHFTGTPGWMSHSSGRIQTTFDPWVDMREHGERSKKRRRR